MGGGGWGSVPNTGAASLQECCWASPDPRRGSASRPQTPLDGVWGGALTPCIRDSIKPTGLVCREEPNLSESSLAGGLRTVRG